MLAKTTCIVGWRLWEVACDQHLLDGIHILHHHVIVEPQMQCEQVADRALIQDLPDDHIDVLSGLDDGGHNGDVA